MGHEGHGGPHPAPPKHFIDKAITATQGTMFSIFARKFATDGMPKVVRREARKAGLR